MFTTEKRISLFIGKISHKKSFKAFLVNYFSSSLMKPTLHSAPALLKY